MKAIIKEPGKKPRITEIENKLSALQEAVGGYIETVTLPKIVASSAMRREGCRGYRIT